MDSQDQEMADFSPPNGNGSTDRRPTMKPQDDGPRARKFQDPGAAIEALVRWDELSEADLHELEADPHLAPRLEMLRSAEAWLENGGGAPRECPRSYETYDSTGARAPAPPPAPGARGS